MRGKGSSVLASMHTLFMKRGGGGPFLVKFAPAAVRCLLDLISCSRGLLEMLRNASLALNA